MLKKCNLPYAIRHLDIYWAGCLEVRLETKLWERMSVAGAQKLVPRWARSCTLCYTEVEDAEHVLFRCPTYERLRAAFWLGSGLDPKVEQAAREVLRGQRGQDHVMWQWMMGGQGTRRVMVFLEQRNECEGGTVASGAVVRGCSGQDQGTLVLNYTPLIKCYIMMFDVY